MLGIADFLSLLKWWGVLFSIGIVFLPVTVRFLGIFFDKGYAFSKIIGTIVLSYIILCVGELHLISFSTANCFLLLLWCGLLQLILHLSYSWKEMLQKVTKYIKTTWAFMLFEEILFLIALYFWSYIRTFAPDIHGLEKFMDYGFVNSILRSTYFPPKDMWYTPMPINYYYFGHLMTAVLTKLSFLSSNITFNLMIATLFALTLTLSFSLGANFFFALFVEKKEKLSFKTYKTMLLGGIFAAFLAALSGNLHTIYSFFRIYNTDTPQPPWKMIFSVQTFPNGYWYPNATRFIYHTIHEFPLYSFVVSDLHGHVLDIPVVLTAVALLFAIYLQKREQAKLSQQESLFAVIVEQLHILSPWIFYSFLLGVMYMTNASDGLIYFLFSLPVIFLLHKKYPLFSPKNIFQLQLFQTVITLFAGLLLFALPFSLFFKSFVSQIGVICVPQFLINKGSIGPFLFEANHCMHSPWWQLLILYGFFAFWFLGLCIILWMQKRKQHSLFRVDIFLLFLGLFAFILIAIPEFVYFKDIYSTYYRANTMFKFVYQAFLLLALLSGYTLVRFFTNPVRKETPSVKVFLSFFGLFGLVLFTLVGMYPYFAIPSYYNNLQNPKTLDGTSYLAALYPSDNKAIEWINTHITGQPVIAEAQGDSYTDYARVSANTGLPTIFGWTVHEWLWRGTYDIAPPRITDVQTLYETPSASVAQAIIHKYDVSFIFVGQLERQKYKLQEAKFQQIGHVVYASGITTIYQVFPEKL
ncbi:MAG TPA: DUF2298 domain-containing protein [Patescibacteria group bacterium]|nr:DUF2298 domain-containing protein [Patescibacteria group bacterium]